jgi:hypothetical protein
MHQKTSNARVGARPLPRGDRWDAAAAAIVLTQLALVAWLIVPGGLYIDDIRAQAYAVDRPIWPFIVESNRTHLSPGARTVDWLQATYWPLEHWPAVVVTLAVSALLGAALWQLLRLVVPRPPFALLGLVLGLFSASLVPALAWYRQTLTTLVALVAILAAVGASIRFFRGGSPAWALLAVFLHAVGLSFSERVLVLPVTVAAAGLLLAPPARSWRRVRQVALVTAPMAAVNLVFLWFYGSGEFDKGTESTPTLSGFLVSTARSLFVNTLPSLFGGPLVWRPAEPAYAYASTPMTMVAAVAVVLLLLVLLGWRSGRSLRPTLGLLGVAAAYIVPIYVILYIGRISRAEVTSVDDLRLYPDVGILMAVVVAALAGTAWPRGARPGRHWRGSLMAALTPVAVVLALSIVSWSGFAARWHTSPTTQYLETLRSDLHASQATVVPGPVPAGVIPGWVQPDFLTASLARLMDKTAEVSLADGPRVIADENGRLRPAHLKTLATAARGSDDFCGNVLHAGDESLSIPFSQPVPYYRGSHLTLRTLVEDTTTLRVSVVGEDGMETEAAPLSQPRLQRGPHTVLVPIPYGVRVSSVTVRSSQASAAVCVPGVSAVLPEVSS